MSQKIQQLKTGHKCLVTSPQKIGHFKSRELGHELLILNSRKNDEKIGVY